MSVSFLINISEDEFKTYLKNALYEILKDGFIFNQNSNSQSPDIMNVKEAAEYLRLQVSTIYEKTSLKLIPHSKKGNKLYFNKKELSEWLREGKIKMQSEIQGNAETYLLKRRAKTKNKD